LWAEGRLKEANTVFSELHKRSTEGVAQHWFPAWLDYRLGHTALAIEGFRVVARRSPSLALRADYWRGRALLDSGRTDEAAGVFRDVAARAPADYYGYQARARLFDLGEPDEDYEAVLAQAGERFLADVTAPGGRIVPSVGDIADIAEPSSPPLARLRSVAAAHGELLPRLPRALSLMELGREADARLELRHMLAELDAVGRDHRAAMRQIGTPRSPFLDRRREPLGIWGEVTSAHSERLSSRVRRAERERLASLRRLARPVREDIRDALRVVNDPWGVRRLTYRLEGHKRGAVQPADRAYHMDTHPLAWREFVVREARNEGLCPIFMWAIMTVESAFHEGRTAWPTRAGCFRFCRGRVGWWPRRWARQRRTPRTCSIRSGTFGWGTWYMARLLERFQVRSCWRRRRTTPGRTESRGGCGTSRGCPSM
jgi:hypothetical protein